VNRLPLRPELDQTSRENNEMLMHEALARARMQEAEQAAQHYRLARRVAAARRWQRLSAWAARRAAQISAGL
jgi:hypothetical protein